MAILNTTSNFLQQGKKIVTALRSLSGDPGDFQLLEGSAARRQAVLTLIEEQSRKADDTFILILIGHGSADKQGWRYNIPGPDINTEDLVAALASAQSRQQLIVVATSASGALLSVLSQPGRTVVSATKSAGEINAVRFPEFFAEAMESGKADVDRNEILTMAEVWRFANRKTQDYYEQHKLLASEHARLTGDAAEQIALARFGALKAARDDPEVAALLEQRLNLEQKFNALRHRKAEMATNAYYLELEELMISIARLQQSIDNATGWVDSDV